MKPKVVDQRSDLVGRLEVVRNEDGTWTARLSNAWGTCLIDWDDNLDESAVEEWVADHLPRALAAERFRA